ncbi:MAG: choice-of-anchor Q domain-containing protein, partial [Solirubrobacteraceae bacterium]
MGILNARKLTLAIVAVVASGLAAAPMANATTYNVNTTADTNAVNPAVGPLDSSGHISLRSAIEALNTIPGSQDMVNVPAGTYTLTSSGGAGQGTAGELVLDDGNGITISGAGSSSTTVDANFLDRAFEENTGPVTISGLKIKNGRSGGIGNVTDCPASPAPEADGGGVLVDNGDLTLTNDVVTGNIAPGAGGGLADLSSDSLTITGTTISNNKACQSSTFLGFRDGGGIGLTGDILAKIDSSVISGNSAVAGGGGLDQQGGTATIFITRSTISSNSAFSGGGVAVDGGGTEATLFGDTLTGNDATNGGGGYENGGATGHIINTTIAKNTSSGQGNGGAGIWTSNGSDIVSFSTITDNTAASGPGNIFVEFGETFANLHIDDSIVARGHGSETNCSHVTSEGFNLFDDTSDNGAQCDANGTTDIVSSPIHLGMLSNNTGPTQTEALLNNSPALDAASGSLCATETVPPNPPPTGAIDQREVPRPQGPQCDIGAYEATPDLNLNGSVQQSPIFVGQQDTVTYVVHNTAPEEADDSTFSDPGAGFQVNSVSTSKGSCTHTNHKVDCQLGTIKPGGTVTIKIHLTGQSKGTITLDGVTSTSGDDLNLVNNRASVHITVKPKPKPPKP